MRTLGEALNDAMASAQYTVQEAQVKKELPATSQRGPMKVWTLSLRDANGEVTECERMKKPGNDFTVGQVVFGYFEPNGDFPPNFKEVQMDKPEEIPGVQKGVEGIQSNGKYDRQPDHPLNVVRTRHTSAMSAAPDYYRLFREENVLPKPEDQAQLKATLKGLMVWLEGEYPPDPRVDG